MSDVTLSLISHTNVGKTTLARTLLRRDVGEVLDAAHVTDKSEAYLLVEEGEDRLLLWDTPGFGDTARLLRRLRQERNPVGWILHQVWDRVTDRPLWCGQEAVRNVREDADLVLYLVNAAEDPEGAGYVGPELELLGWLQKPVLVLLNKLGDEAEGAAVERWRAVLSGSSIVHDVLPLDAFTRSWVQEEVLFERVGELLPAELAAPMARLSAAWRRRNRAIFERSMELLGAHLARAAADREPLARSASRGEKKRATERLAKRLEASERELWDAIVAAHELEGELARELRRELSSVQVEGEDLLTPRKGALIGGAVSGAVSGLMADLLAGGLTFGGGLLAGTILGALGGAGLSRAVRLIQGTDQPQLRWSREFLEVLFARAAVRYLAVARFGRGRGRLTADSESPRIRDAVQEALAAGQDTRSAMWRHAEPPDPDPRPLVEALTAVTGKLLGLGDARP